MTLNGDQNNETYSRSIGNSQREYRDAIDFRKTLQLIPGLGAVVGAWANYGLVDDLGIIGMNCYRLRIIGGISVGKGYSTRN